MKQLTKVVSAILLLCMLFLCTVSCGGPTEDGTQQDLSVDYAAQVKLDMTSETVKQAVTVKTYVDGDTTHFYVPTSISESGVLKARYLAINTPESTGKIEEYGKKASNFTKEKLSSATSIIVESDDGNWNLDSTGTRYLVWIWYRTSETEEYRNLNIEILQNGLAIASSSANNRYGTTCMSAISQAKANQLNVYSGQPDPDFYYGEAVELTLKELRCNIEDYSGIQVAFTGIITLNYSNGVYVESYDAETDMYYGMYVYYGYTLPGAGLEILAVGNEARIVGTVQYYETGGTYQVAGLSYRQMQPNDPNNIQKISDGHSPAYVETDAQTFAQGKVTVETDDGNQVFDYAALAMGTSIEMKNLTVRSVYTTSDEESSSYGAMTLTCEVNGVTVSVRTIVLYDEDKNLVTAEAYQGKNIDVKGIIDYYNGTYQIKVFSQDSIIINN